MRSAPLLLLAMLATTHGLEASDVPLPQHGFDATGLPANLIWNSMRTTDLPDAVASTVLKAADGYLVLSAEMTTGRQPPQYRSTIIGLGGGRTYFDLRLTMDAHGTIEDRQAIDSRRLSVDEPQQMSQFRLREDTLEPFYTAWPHPFDPRDVGTNGIFWQTQELPPAVRNAVLAHANHHLIADSRICFQHGHYVCRAILSDGGPKPHTDLCLTISANGTVLEQHAAPTSIPRPLDRRALENGGQSCQLTIPTATMQR